jgi:DNA-binding LytR/AlgR family response regulator
MKLVLNQIKQGEEEVIIRYLEMNEEIKNIIRSAGGNDKRIPGFKAEAECMISIRDILYVESVDRGTFAYTMREVYKIPYVLNKVELEFSDNGFFRCSKSMVINIHTIEELRSEPGNRIDAKLLNGEHIIISRRYAKELRNELRGDKDE